jgi:RHS repeat-associated protein
MEDPGTGLVYMQQRYYDPTIGRFLSVDPVGPLSDPSNHFGRYHYAYNNPYRYVDPNGEAATAFVMSGLGADLAVPDPTDLAPPKWGGWAVVIVGAVIIDAAMSGSGEGSSSLPAPGGLVGEQDAGSRTQGGRHNSGPLAPENGGTGNAEADYETLTGGSSSPAPDGSRLPAGSRVGENGVIYRPEAGSTGPRIDIPASGDKPHETLHYPKPTPPPERGQR